VSRRAIAIGVGAALLVLLLWWFLLRRPQRSRISDAQDRREAAAQQAAQLQVTLSRLQDLKRTEALKRSQIEALRVAVPDQPNLAQFILDANDAANQAGIDFISISPSPPAAAGPATGGTAGTPGARAAAPASITLAMNVTGGYFQVLDFLNRLNDLPRIVVIDSLSLTPGSGTDTSRLSATISARMFTTSTPATGGATGSTTTTRPAAGTTTTVAPATTTTAGAP